MTDRLVRVLVALLPWSADRRREVLASSQLLASERGRFGAMGEIGSLAGLVVAERTAVADRRISTSIRQGCWLAGVVATAVGAVTLAAHDDPSTTSRALAVLTLAASIAASAGLASVARLGALVALGSGAWWTAVVDDAGSSIVWTAFGCAALLAGDPFGWRVCLRISGVVVASALGVMLIASTGTPIDRAIGPALLSVGLGFLAVASADARFGVAAASCTVWAVIVGGGEAHTRSLAVMVLLAAGAVVVATHHTRRAARL